MTMGKEWGQLGVGVGLLDAKCCDEDIDYNNDEDECCGDILHNVQLEVHALIVHVPLYYRTRERHQNMLRINLLSPSMSSIQPTEGAMPVFSSVASKSGGTVWIP